MKEKSTSGARLQSFKVMIDPGHGGDSSGVTGSAGLLEKDVNLVVSLHLASILSACGHTVFLTRRNDSSISNSRRARLANKVDVAVFVSVHHGGALRADPLDSRYSVSDENVNGTEVWIYEPQPMTMLPHQKVVRDKSRRLAHHVYTHLCQYGGLKERGISTRGDVTTLRLSVCPSIHCIPCFLSNPGQEILLRDSNYLQGEAQAIAEGVNDYLREAFNLS